MLRLFLLDLDLFGGHNLHLSTKISQTVTVGFSFESNGPFTLVCGRCLQRKCSSISFVQDFSSALVTRLHMVVVLVFFKHYVLEECFTVMLLNLIGPF